MNKYSPSIEDRYTKYSRVSVLSLVISLNWLLLIGVRAIVAKSFERIHRSNLIGMGLLPLEFEKGQGIEEIGIQSNDQFSILGLDRINDNQKKEYLKRMVK